MSYQSGFYIDPSARINVPFRLLQGCVTSEELADIDDCELPERMYIGPFTCISKGVRLGLDVIVDAYCSIDPNVVVGSNTLITYRASIGCNTKIGEDCVIGGIVPENCIVGDRCRVFGNIIHSHIDPTMSWDHHAIPEVSPRIHDDTFIGFGSFIIGDVDVGPKSYVCANATVTRSVPPFHIAYGVNQMVNYSAWRGQLATSPFFLD